MPEGGHPEACCGTALKEASAIGTSHLDGLFTYCLSVLHDHDRAVAALGEVLDLAKRYRSRLRDGELHRPWLYALARQVCVQRLSLASSAAAVPAWPAVTDEVARRRRAELAALAWPEAVGTVPRQREALELAVRHGLPTQEVAAVLGLDTAKTRTLLSRAAYEVERTRAALAVLAAGRCAALGQLAGDVEELFSAALREELVTHIDHCRQCRSAAERAMAARPAAGGAGPEVLPLIEAPRDAVLAAMTSAPQGAGQDRTRTSTRAQARRAAALRFDRRGFPVEPKDRAARRAALWNRAVTTTVVAAVIAAPVLAMWVVQRAGEQESPAQEVPKAAADGEAPSAGVLRSGDGGPGVRRPGDAGDRRSPGGKPGERSPTSSQDPDGTPADVRTSSSADSSPGARPKPAPGRLSVSVQQRGADRLITLTVSGGSAVHWRATTQAAWVQLSQTSGVLEPGTSTTVVVSVNHDREPSGPWSARVSFAPSGAAVTIDGTGQAPSPSEPSPTTSAPTSTPDQPDSQ